MAAIDRLLHMMVEQRASDLHLSTDEVPMMRTDGEMFRVEGEEKYGAQRLLAIMHEIAPDLNWREFQGTNDTDFAYPIEGVGRFRVNFFQDLRGPGCVLRLIPSQLMTVEDLKLTPQVLNLCMLNKGLVLVTGPTGSGKSTTLAGMIDYINRVRTAHIISIEDPIEFVHENKRCLINQREVRVHTDGFKKALRAALREDPDVVLIGEMRDLETIQTALEIAETGHLVFATLHTTTAHQTVDRIVDQFPADQQEQIRMMLAGTLRAVLSQTLLKKKGLGRVMAMETLIVTPAVAAGIREGKTHQIPVAMQTGQKYGMVELNLALLRLVESGQVSPREAYWKAIDKDRMQRMMEERGIRVSTRPETPPDARDFDRGLDEPAAQVAAPRPRREPEEASRPDTVAPPSPRRDRKPPPWSLGEGVASAKKKKDWFG